MIRDYAYYKEALKDVRMPCAFLDMDSLDENISQILERANGTRIRVASKSVRSLPMLKYLLDAAPLIQGVMAFSGEEAVFLSQNGLDDILLGYPVAQKASLEAICKEVAKGKKIILMIDNTEQAERANTIAAAQNVTLELCMDADMSTSFPGLHFGVFRSPIRSAEAALELRGTIKSLSNVKLTGIMGYEAQIAGVTDQSPYNGIKNPVISLLKQRSIPRLAQRRKEIVATLRKAGAEIGLVNGGGTGSIESTIQEPWVTEVTVGSGFYNSHLFDYYKGFRHQPAAGFAVEVVRKPEAGVVTCHGGGYVASGTPGKDKVPLPWLPEGMKLIDNEAAGEVQTPLTIPQGLSIGIGDPVFFRHSKAGELCERFNDLHLIRNGEVVETVRTYRGDGKCFL